MEVFYGPDTFSVQMNMGCAPIQPAWRIVLSADEWATVKPYPAQIKRLRAFIYDDADGGLFAGPQCVRSGLCVRVDASALLPMGPQDISSEAGGGLKITSREAHLDTIFAGGKVRAISREWMDTQLQIAERRGQQGIRARLMKVRRPIGVAMQKGYVVTVDNLGGVWSYEPGTQSWDRLPDLPQDTDGE